MGVPLPPKLENFLAGTQLVAGLGVSTVLADMDFETYSHAGFYEKDGKLVGPHGSDKMKGLPAIGVRCYAEHETTEILSLAYDLKDGHGKRFWIPGALPPLPLFVHLARGGLIEAHNSGFEQTIWEQVCVPRMGWPEIKQTQWRCSAAKARAFGLPGSLGNLCDVLKTTIRKEKDGERLLKKFSMPSKPTKKNPNWRTRVEDDPVDAWKLYGYNATDIASEAEASSRIPDLSSTELEVWQADQAINRRGVAVDSAFVTSAIKIIEDAYKKYEATLPALTGGIVTRASEVGKIKAWAFDQFDVRLDSLDDDVVQSTLARKDIVPALRKVLEIRSLTGSASVKKLYALDRQTSKVGRVHDLFTYHGARTGRDTGSDAQPQNFPNSGPDVAKCECGRFFDPNRNHCPSCNCDRGLCGVEEWNPDAMEQAIEIVKMGSLETVEAVYGDALKTISGCLRGAFIASPGHELVSSDYSAIEAVVAAALAGETWRLEAFAEKKDIYLASISKMTGAPYEEYIAHKKSTGSHHPHRKLGKVAELASGYGGWIPAWVNFGADKFFDGEDEIKRNIKAWRAASPNIVEMWGGQSRGWGYDARPELYGLEGMAIAAITNPGQTYAFRSISYVFVGGVLYCELPSCRRIAYHNATVSPSKRNPAQLSISYEGWNTNPKMGGRGWVRMETYGGKLFENVVQAVARDIMMHAMVNFEKQGIAIVLRVHDELVAEVPKGTVTVEQFEAVMNSMPLWASGWPVRAAGGWIAGTYRKD